MANGGGGAAGRRDTLPQAVQDLCDLASGLWVLDGDFGEKVVPPTGQALENALKQVTWQDGSTVLKLLGVVEAPLAPRASPTSLVSGSPGTVSATLGGARDKLAIVGGAGGAGSLSGRRAAPNLAEPFFQPASSPGWLGEKSVKDNCMGKVSTLSTLSWGGMGTRDSLPTIAATATRDSLPSCAVFTRETLPRASSPYLSAESVLSVPRTAGNPASTGMLTEVAYL